MYKVEYEYACGMNNERTSSQGNNIHDWRESNIFCLALISYDNISDYCKIEIK